MTIHSPAPIAGLVGTTVRGYAFEALIAQGGFGQVYRAYQPVVERQVAVKVIVPQYANLPAFVRRFDLEAQMVAQLEHPYIVPLYDYWRDPSGAYLIMRLMRGGSLASLLDGVDGPLPIALAARVLEQVAAALTTAHRNGIIHRDLKPANILLDEERNAYLADFGIAKRLFTDEQYEFDRFGSPAYVAPEIVSGDVISAQSDIYSLGIILYEMLTGTLPYNAPSQTLVLQQHLTGDIPSVMGLRPDLPADVDEVISRATQREQKDRYTDATAMAEAFQSRVLGQVAEATGKPALVQPLGGSQQGRREPGRQVRTPILNIAALAQKNPYKGLRAFQEADQNDFHGRENIVQRLTERLRGAGISSRCVALIGASGSGKSSLVRAGLLPALRRAAVPGSNKWFFAIMTPGTTPLAELEQTISRIAINTIDGLAEQLLTRPDVVNQLIERVLPSQGEFLLFVDQFEEVFSLAKSDAERNAFLETLSRVIQNPRARLILTLRADYVDTALAHPAFGTILRDCSEFVLPLSVSEMEAAISKPAERLGVHFEPGLISRIIHDIGSQPGTLPLLQYVLYELYEQRTGNILNTMQYDSEGGVFGALARRAENLYAALEPRAQGDAKRLFLSLVVVKDDSEDTRRRITQTEAKNLGANPESIQTVLEAFGRHRLLTFDHDSVTRMPTVEIAHEALIRHWSRLRSWIDENRTLLAQRQQFASATAEWIASNRDHGLLARGARLVTYETIPGLDSVVLTSEEQEFLEASLRLRRQESLRAVRVIAGLAGIAIIAIIAAIFALIQRNDANYERERADLTARLARADQLAIQATTNRGNLDLSLLLSIEALNSAQTFEAKRSLLDGLQVSPQLTRYFYTAPSAVRDITINQEETSLAAASADGTILVWSLEVPGGAPTLMTGHRGAVNAVSFSPDGSLVVSGGADGTVRLWDVANGSEVGDPLEGHQRPVWDVAFSPDGGVLASAGEDAGILLWDIETRTTTGDALRGHEGTIYALAFSPDGVHIASGSEDGTLRIWNAEGSGEEPIILSGHENWVLDVEYSPDGTLLASGDASGIVNIWSVDDAYARAREPIPASPGSYVWDIVFRDDSQQLATASADDVVRLWDLRMADTSMSSLMLAGHTNDVWSLAYTRDHQLFSGGRDGRVMQWNSEPQPAIGTAISSDFPLVGLAIGGNGQIATGTRDSATGAIAQIWESESTIPNSTLRTSANQTTALAFIPDTDSLLITDSARRLLLWEPNIEQLQRIATVPFILYTLAISPSGQVAAIAGDSNLIHVYELAEPYRQVAVLNSPSSPVYALEFSPDGAVLASGSVSGELTRWRTEDWSQEGNTLTLATADISALAYSPDGSQLAVGTRDLLAPTIQVFDAGSFLPLTGVLTGHQNWIVDLHYLDDSTLASASHDHTIRLWSLPSGDSLRLLGHLREVTGITSPGDGELLSASEDRRLIRWELALESWIMRACTIAGRNLNADEWRQFMGNIPYRSTCPNP